MMLRLTRPMIVATACAASLLVAFAAPASAATAPAKWGKAFCGAVGDWGATIQAESAELDQIDPATLTPPQHKALVVGFLGEASDATGDFRATVRKAGDPAVKNGKQIQATILEGIAGVDALLGSIISQVQALPTTDTVTYRTAAAPIEPQLDNLALPFQNAMDDVSSLEKKKQLSKALEKVRACRTL